MHQDFNALSSFKKDVPKKQFFVFPTEKYGSSSPTRDAEKKYFINSNYNQNSSKNIPLANMNTCTTKNMSKRSIDRTTIDPVKKPLVVPKIQIIPRQTMVNSKKLIIKDFNNCSPPKDLKTLTTVNRTKAQPFPDRSSVLLESVQKKNMVNSPQTTSSQISSKFTRLRIVSREKNQNECKLSKLDGGAQKEPLYIKKQVAGVSPNTKQKIDFCIKMDKIISVKSRSNDIKKPDVSRCDIDQKKKNNFASEDKDQTKYILGDKVLKTVFNPSHHMPAYTEKKETIKNKYFLHLKMKSQESEEISEISNTIRTSFADWKNSKNMDFFSFKTPADFYKIKQKIGKGCFGKVYLATQKLTGCDVALKVITKTNIKNKDSRKKIEKEVEILQQVNHSHSIIKLFEVFEDDNSVYLAFEYLPNGDLVQFFKKQPLFDENELAPFYHKILKGIKYLHENKILHRDIKLDNILLDKNLNPKVCDFGISSIAKEGLRIYDTGGTPAYLAPEVIKAEGFVCEKSDVWSLGVLLYLLTFGIVPFKATDMQVLYNKIIIGTFKFPEYDDTSKELIDLIKRMLVVDIDKRLSLEQVMNHSWFKNVEIENTLESNQMADKDEAITEGIFSYLHYVGFPEDYISQSLSKNKFNHIKACMDTLKAKFLKY